MATFHGRPVRIDFGRPLRRGSTVAADFAKPVRLVDAESPPRADSTGTNGIVESGVPPAPTPKKHGKQELYDLVGALHGQGFHGRLIARILGVSHVYASRVLHDLELERPRQKLTVEQALTALPAELRASVDSFRERRAEPTGSEGQRDRERRMGGP